MKYTSEIIHEIIETEGHIAPSMFHYESECKEEWIEYIRGAYPKLTDYEGEWLNYYLENGGIGKFPYLAFTNITQATSENCVPIRFKSAILKGCTGYRDIDTGEILETFEEGRNLELVTVKMPVLTTSNEDGTKTNILTVNDDVELRGIGDVKDTLDCLTGELTERIGEIVLDGSEKWKEYEASGTSLKRFVCEDKILNAKSYNEISNILPNNGVSWTKDITNLAIDEAKKIVIQFNSTDSRYNYSLDEFKQWLSQNPITVQYELSTESVKTVDLSVVNQDGEQTSLKAFEGTTHIQTNGQPIKPLLDIEVPVEAITQNLESFIEEE